MSRRKHDAPADDETAPQGRQLAPIEPNAEPESADPSPTSTDAAPVFPTEADVDRLTAQLVADDATLANRPHLLARALAPLIASEADRLSRAKKRAPVLETLVAPVFPTEAHVEQLRAAIPFISADDSAAVLNAGHAAFVASVAAGEPITDVPDDGEVAA